jgi:hypothetical protein
MWMKEKVEQLSLPGGSKFTQKARPGDCLWSKILLTKVGISF